MDMTSKERVLTAIRNQVPDRIPVMPDISNMIPCRLTGKPFWEVYLYNNPGLYKAYSDAVEYFGIDGWFQADGAVQFERKTKVEIQSEIISRDTERIIQNVKYITNKGDLHTQMTYYSNNSPTPTEKMVKDLQKDYYKIKELYSEIIGFDASNLEEMRKICGYRGIFCLSVGYPGMHYWNEFFEGNLPNVIYAYQDEPEIFDEWAYMLQKDFIRQSEILLDLKPDVLLLGGSGTLTLSTPELVRKYSLPSIKEITKMARQEGVPTMLHSCGKSLFFLDMLVNETDLNCINPLEEPPMGDCCLKDVKDKYGAKICLMGNIHTTDIMLQGSSSVVETVAMKAIDDAGRNGGFILSTGDQCGRDTPDENILKLVEVAKTYGKY